MSRGYYAHTLSAERLQRCYAIAPPRVRRYLDSEIGFVAETVGQCARILELGCGYGRVLACMPQTTRLTVGIDTSIPSLALARTHVPPHRRSCLAAMDAARLGLSAECVDGVICIQNGISALQVDRRRLIEEALRVVRRGGTVLFSSYTAAFWEHRLDWFRLQADHGLIGEIDEHATGDGVIVCRDGFRATTLDERGFRALTAGLGAGARFVEVDGSSLFCVLTRA